MIGERLLEFLAMGGFALYVWGSYAVALAVVLIEIVLLILRRRAIVEHLGWPAADLKTPLNRPDGERSTQHHRSDRDGIVETELREAGVARSRVACREAGLP